MSEHESISNYGDSSTAVMPRGFCPFCSSNFSFVYHQGRCPEVEAREYHQNGGLKRIEFVNESRCRETIGQPTLRLDQSATGEEFLINTKWAREVVIEEPTLLKPGRYTIVLGELRRIIDNVPPGLA